MRMTFVYLSGNTLSKYFVFYLGYLILSNESFSIFWIKILRYMCANTLFPMVWLSLFYIFKIIYFNCVEFWCSMQALCCSARAFSSCGMWATEACAG